MRRGLLTPQDVVRFTPLKLPFSPLHFRELYAMEEADSLEFLGELWRAMVEAQVDYSTAQPYVYRPEGYAAGAVVAWDGGYREALTLTTQDPSHRTDWADAPKFTGPCAGAYAELYCTYVGPYLAFVVLSERYPYIVTQVGEGGVTYEGRSINAQDQGRIDSQQRALYRDRARAKALLINNLKHPPATAAGSAAPCLIGWRRADDDKPYHRCGCGCAGGSGHPCTELHSHAPHQVPQGQRSSIGGYRWG